MSERDEIEKAAEDLGKIFNGDENTHITWSEEDYIKAYRVLFHLLESDRARRDSLEEMLVELATHGNVDIGQDLAGNGWFVLVTNSTVGEVVSTNYFGTPTEAARAALDELKGGGDAQ